MEAIDDDFGELYANVEVQATSAINGISDFARLYIESEKDYGNGAKDKDVKLKEHFVSDEKKMDSACGEDSTHSGSEGLQINSVKEVNDYIESDSEDDLNIVLNDEDCRDFPVGVGGNRGVVTGVSYDEGDFVAEGSNLGKNGNCGDQLAGGSELVTCNGHSGQSKNGMKRGYGSQFFLHKYIRTRQSGFVNNTKAKKSVGIAFYSSPLNRGGWTGNACNKNQVSTSCNVVRVCAAANPSVVQRGYGSFLPRHWSIFDVNIDTLEEKPWRIPGVDITNYFNFDFNENTWKEYCASLKKLWLASIETSTTINEASNLNQEAMEQLDQVVSGSLLSPSSECELPRGRAIQVEDSMEERQPSMDVRRPRSRDSDVVIQIRVHESSDDCSDSGNSNVHKASEEGEFNGGNNKNILSSGSGHDDKVSEDHLEDEKKSENSSVLKRYGSGSGVDKVESQNQIVQPSQDAKETLNDKTAAEEDICIDTCSADPCSIESELSFGDHDLSLTSYSDSDFEATKNSVHVSHEKSQGPLRRKSVNSVTDLKESASSYHETAKSNSSNKKLRRKDYYSRYKGPARQGQRHQSARCQPSSKLNKYVEIDNGHPMSGARDMSLLDHEFVDYDSKKKLMRDFSFHKRRDVSYYRETERSCHYGEKFVDECFHSVYTKYPDGEGRGSFRENRSRFVRKNWEERECFSERRSQMAHDVDSERDWYHADIGHSADDMSPLTYWESRQFLSEHSSFPDKERATRRGIYDRPQFRDRNSRVDDYFDECENEFINRSYGMPTVAERELEFLDYKQEESFPHIDRKPERSARRGRHHDRLPSDLDGLWSEEMEDEGQEYTRHQALNLLSYRRCYTMSEKHHVYDKGVNNKFGGCQRHKYARKDRTNDWNYGYNDAAEDKDCLIHPWCELERRRYSSPSEVLHWVENEFAAVENEFAFGQQDELHDDEVLFSYEKTSRCERTRARYASLLGKIQIDDVQLQQHQLNMSKVGSEKRSSKIIFTGKHGQTLLRCRNSVGLVNGEEKSYGRSSRARNLVCNARLENLDQGIAKKRKAIADFDDSLNRAAIRSDISNSRGNRNKRKYPKNTPDNWQKEGFDLEGQIVTEEPYIEAAMSRRVVSEDLSLNDSVEKRMSQKENDPDQDKIAGGYDSQQILETLAKMEKRRERFKEPITKKKEAEQKLNLNVEQSLKLEDDLVVDTDTVKQHRPARKRRWAAS